jgi:putative ABC transport system substrate-binding protein
MKRREFITLIGSAAVSLFKPVAAGAQQAERLARIGYLSLTSPPLNAYDDAFLAGLRDLGYVEGKNLHIEFRFTEGQEDRLARLATELVDLNVDVIVTYATGVYAAKRATATIPIVMETTGDLVATIAPAPKTMVAPGGPILSKTP